MTFYSHFSSIQYDIIPGMGLEPTHIAVLDFESSASTNSAILAKENY